MMVELGSVGLGMGAMEVGVQGGEEREGGECSHHVMQSYG